jgi:hypothetical protein
MNERSYTTQPFRMKKVKNQTPKDILPNDSVAPKAIWNSHKKNGNENIGKQSAISKVGTNRSFGVPVYRWKSESVSLACN